MLVFPRGQVAVWVCQSMAKHTSQLLPFPNTDLEKLYAFGKLPLRKIPMTRDALPLEVQRNIEIESYP